MCAYDPDNIYDASMGSWRTWHGSGIAASLQCGLIYHWPSLAQRRNDSCRTMFPVLSWSARQSFRLCLWQQHWPTGRLRHLRPGQEWEARSQPRAVASMHARAVVCALTSRMCNLQSTERVSGCENTRVSSTPREEKVNASTVRRTAGWVRWRPAPCARLNTGCVQHCAQPSEGPGWLCCGRHVSNCRSCVWPYSCVPCVRQHVLRWCLAVFGKTLLLVKCLAEHVCVFVCVRKGSRIWYGWGVTTSAGTHESLNMCVLPVWFAMVHSFARSIWYDISPWHTAYLSNSSVSLFLDHSISVSICLLPSAFSFSLCEWTAP